MKHERKKSFLDQVAETTPGMSEIVAEIKRERKSGAIRDAPQTLDRCADWRDGWLYIFQSASLHPADFLRVEDGRVTCVVLVGGSFGDQSIGIAEEIAARLGPDEDLLELRLVATRVTESGAERMRRVIPRAQINTFTGADREGNPRVAYADPGKARRMFPGP
jgi:hypothetical protein